MASELDTKIKALITALKAEKVSVKAYSDEKVAEIEARIVELQNTNARLTAQTEADIALLKSLGLI